MFAYIKGFLVYSSPSSVIIEAGNLGYKIFIPVNVFQRLPQLREELVLHLTFVVREQAQSLYGFISVEERDFFESLLGVTGIGPKIALALIGHMPLKELQQAIVQEEIPILCRVPGIGKKGAERLIIEMRDKVNLGINSASNFAIQTPLNAHMQTVNDAMSALINLGYNQITAQKALKKSLRDIPDCEDLAFLISSALKHV